MKIIVKARTNAKQQKVEKIGENEFLVSVCQPPVEGKANKAIIEALSDFFHIPKSRFRIKLGESSKNKIIEIV